MKFSEVFKDLLIENETDVQGISQKIDIEDSILYDYLHGSMPKVCNAVIIANYFNVSLNYLMGIDENPKSTKFKNDYDIKLFANRYDKLLKENKVSHYRLSKEKKLNYSSHYMWRRGAIPSMSSLIIIANYFGVSIDYLVGRSDVK